MRIAVLVVSLPERHELLKEALDSVRAQTRQPDDVLVGIDHSYKGEVANMNRLVDAAGDVDWLAFLHDDDVLLPHHLSTAVQFMGDADVIVSRFELVGRSHIEPQHDNFEDLRSTNWFPPSAVVARREVFGHWTEPDKPAPHDWIDWHQWRVLLDAGARFVHTDQVTMQYRFGPWNKGRSYG